jgi:hypothetical protein
MNGSVAARYRPILKAAHMCVHGKARLVDAGLCPLSQLGRPFRPTTHRTVPRGERDGAVARTRGWRHAMHRRYSRRVSWRRLQAACCRLHRVRRIGQEHGGCSGALFSVWTLASDNGGQAARRSPRGTWRRANDAPLMRCLRRVWDAVRCVLLGGHGGTRFTRHAPAAWAGVHSPPHQPCASGRVPRGEHYRRRGGDPIDVGWS